MAHLTKEKSFLASLLDDMGTTLHEGEEAVERVLAGRPARGDQQRVRRYKALAEWMTARTAI